jgi:1,2-diacylglycerol 3-beta-galactosyltransferase
VKILLLYSDTGGGHRSAARAIRQAIEAEAGPGAHHIEWVDVITHYAPFPFKYLPDSYPFIIGPFQPVWAWAFHTFNHRWASDTLSALVSPLVNGRIKRVLADFQPDLLVSVHPLVSLSFGRYPRAQRPPLLSVVTDPITVHALWFNIGIDQVIVATDEGRACALRFGFEPERVTTIGMPVDAAFCAPTKTKAQARAALNWHPTLPAVLIMSGGEGVGPVAEITNAIAASRLPCQVAVVAGRNEKLKAQLQAQPWPIPVHVYGFVANVPDLMTAADVFVSKAGPGSITEALNLGLPILLFSRIGGQEEGNVDYVIKNQVGMWTPRPAQVVEALRQWFNDPALLAAAAARAQRIAHPEAARVIARHVLALGKQPPR